MNYYPILSKKYPEGSIQGQCFAFCHKLVIENQKFPGMPPLLNDKIRVLNQYGIPINKLDTIKVGDVLLLKYPVWGHGAFVNAIIGNNLQLTESNFNLDLKVHHTRQIPVHDPKILGVFRGDLNFLVPTPTFPRQLKVMFLMNHPTWNSWIAHMANLQNWFWQASGQKIELIIDYKQVNLSGWTTEFTGSVFGSLSVEVIKEDWFNQNVMPLAGDADIVIFNMERNQWKGTVFDHPELMEAGYCYEKIGMSKPIKAFTVSDEHDDYPPYYPALGAYAKLAAHEIMHGLYGVACSDKYPAGSDLTHNHFYGPPQFLQPMKPEDCFADFDYSKF